jgi:hypothetical protein
MQRQRSVVSHSLLPETLRELLALQITKVGKDLKAGSVFSGGDCLKAVPDKLAAHGASERYLESQRRVGIWLEGCENAVDWICPVNAAVRSKIKSRCFQGFLLVVKDKLRLDQAGTTITG